MKECEEMAEAMAAILLHWCAYGNDENGKDDGEDSKGRKLLHTGMGALTAYRAARRRNEEAVVYPHHDNLDGPCACGAWHKLDR